MDDDIQNNIRKGLDIATATGYGPYLPAQFSNMTAEGPQEGRPSTSRKRPFSQTGLALPPSKQSRSASSSKTTAVPLNRVHRRVIVKDYGKVIYKASSRSALLTALKDQGLASGAKGKTGTRAFMSVGALLGEQHSYMHDLESIFWVLFWICIFYDKNGKDIGSIRFDSWNFESDDGLAARKKAVINDEEDFLETMDEYFTSHYRPMAPWVNLLRREVFPNNQRWKHLEPELYTSMKRILRDAQKDPAVLADG
ncbi:hypothetical protein LCI18_002806 [Fusarium solani-melongenae]|uniref:Uncharacterized protein n=1 Tax=Fusarium solani subsp. cucurbitae TaxID=2747967 RepID=A0ACD3YSD8_FUSSC|nr:hypothetical protein LCI18_002806 [Fusarium solani-melongenae]